jgi:hypothetical protein
MGWLRTSGSASSSWSASSAPTAGADRSAAPPTARCSPWCPAATWPRFRAFFLRSRPAGRDDHRDPPTSPAASSTPA